VLIDSRGAQSAAAATQRAISEGTKILFEAEFAAGPYVARADILERVADGWHVLEVKSSFSDTSDLDGLIDDVAYTVMVAKRAGLDVVSASLLLLSRDYRFGDAPERLFMPVEVRDAALARAAEFESAADATASGLFSERLPSPKLASICRECAVFGDQCLGVGLTHTVLEIPGLHYRKLLRLSAEGIVSLEDLPPDLSLNERQQRAVKSSVAGKLCVEDSLGEALDAIVWPCHYLDFETVATVLPLYPGHVCHQQVLTQFSIHHRDRIDGELQHSEFLADATKDCQREVAEALISALGHMGSIIVYSPFEKTRIKALQGQFADLADALQAVLDRIVDLHPIIADHVYHPNFHGSYSIKKVLPALVPDLSYAGLAVRDGDTAITQFARMARGQISGAAAEQARRDLLDYCKVDTLAMVRLHEKLVELASNAVR
jgi:predicted RecB family nuclease